MRRQSARFLPLVIIAASILAALTVAHAEDVRTSVQSVYIVDYQTGSVMLDRDSTARGEPASLTKMMTAYLALEALKTGKIKLTDTLPVSGEARRMQGSRTFVERGSSVEFEDLLRGIIVESGNAQRGRCLPLSGAGHRCFAQAAARAFSDLSPMPAQPLPRGANDDQG
jgi:D-alanyl-D-alanine carboxypeptidase (penicillin-binding protein 5/6)